MRTFGEKQCQSAMSRALQTNEKGGARKLKSFVNKVAAVLLTALVLAFSQNEIMAQPQFPATDPSNIARFKPTKSSSVYEVAHSNRAVDGNTNGNWLGGSIFHSQQENSPWWEVDLLQPYDISEIIIHNRTDCCPERLKNFTIRVSQEPFNGNSDGTIFNIGNVMSFRGSKSFRGNVRGQYIRIQLNQKDFLHFAEVVVRGTLVDPSPKKISPVINLALNKLARQSSVYNNSGAQKAIDGDENGNWYSGSVAHTELQEEPWWEVDLGKNYMVTSVVVVNRTDCCSERLSNFNIWVTPRPKDQMREDVLPFSTEPKDLGSAKQKRFSPEIPQIGRYVRLQLNGTNYLNLAEVKVFGEEFGDLVIGERPLERVFWAYVVDENNGSTPKKVSVQLANSVSEGFNYERTVEKTDKGWFELGVTSTVEQKIFSFKASLSINAKGGAEWTKRTAETQGESASRSRVETKGSEQDIPPGKKYYFWRKFVINEVPISYTKAGQTYSWTAVLNKSDYKDEITLEVPAGTTLELLPQSNTYWVPDAEFQKIYSRHQQKNGKRGN